MLTSYSESNYDTDVYLNGSNFYVGQVVQSANLTDGTLTSAKFYLKKTGSPAGNISVEFWTAMGPVVAAASDVVDVSTLSTSYGLIEFTFSGVNQLVFNGTVSYYVVVKYVDGDVSNYVHVGVDKSSSTYANGWLFLSPDGSDYDPYNSDDCCFYIYGDVTVAAPDAPINISATDGDYNDKVVVIWDSVDGVDSYNIYRATSDSSGSSSLIGSSLTTSYNDTSAVSLTTYWYWVKSVLDEVESDFSESDDGYAKAKISKPTISATDGTYSDRIIVSASSPSGADSWTFYKNTVDVFSSASSLGSQSTPSYTDTNITPAALYYYWVRCDSTDPDYDQSDVSDSDSGYAKFSTTGGGSGGEIIDGAGVPSLTVYGETEANLLWTAIDGAVSYNLYKGTSSGGETLFKSVSDITYIDTDVTVDITYFYTVTAVGEADESGHSNEVSIKIHADTGEYSGRGIDVRNTTLLFKCGRPMKEVDN